jgi:hypothetical protein
MVRYEVFGEKLLTGQEVVCFSESQSLSSSSQKPTIWFLPWASFIHFAPNFSKLTFILLYRTSLSRGWHFCFVFGRSRFGISTLRRMLIGFSYLVIRSHLRQMLDSAVGHDCFVPNPCQFFIPTSSLYWRYKTHAVEKASLSNEILSSNIRLNVRSDISLCRFLSKFYIHFSFPYTYTFLRFLSKFYIHFSFPYTCTFLQFLSNFYIHFFISLHIYPLASH